MRDVLVRAVVAVPVSVLLPFGIAGLRPRARRGAIAAVLIAAALAPHLGRWQAWVIVGAGGLAAALPGEYDIGRPALPVGLTLAATAVAVAVGGLGTFSDALTAVADTRGVVIVAGGALACVFLGGAVIGRALHPFAIRVRVAEGADVAGMENAGRYIGWLERALLFGLLTAGAPDAAALVVAGKSIARFPSFSQERFAEYYLIGSLLSLLIAVACAGAVRAALGLALIPGR